MKNSKLVSALFGLLAVLFAGSFFASCSKDPLASSGTTHAQMEPAAAPGLFSKEITVQDPLGRDALVILVSGDDMVLIEGFSPDNFELKMLPGSVSGGEVDDSVEAGDPAGAQAFQLSDVHITVLKSLMDPGQNNLQLAVKPGTTGASDRFATEFWLHNNAFNYSKVWASATFYVEGYYCGLWPYWSKCCAGWRSNTGWVARGYCGNRSIHITQSNTNTLYWAFGN